MSPQVCHHSTLVLLEMTDFMADAKSSISHSASPLPERLQDQRTQNQKKSVQDVTKQSYKYDNFTNLRASSLHWEFFSPSAKVSAHLSALLPKVLFTMCSSVNTECGMQRAEEIVLYSQTPTFTPEIL